MEKPGPCGFLLLSSGFLRRRRLFFGVLAAVVGLVASLFTRIDAARVTAALLSSLVVYDLLTLTARFSSRSRVLFNHWRGCSCEPMVSKTSSCMWNEFVNGLCLGSSRPGVIVFRWNPRVAVGLGNIGATTNLPAAAPDAPNVLVIVVDTLRADHFLLTVMVGPTSPIIDAFGPPRHFV